MKTPTNLIALFARGREIGFVIVDAQGEIYRYGVKAIRGCKFSGTKPHVAGQPDVVLFGKVGKTVLQLLTLVAEPGVIVVERIDAGDRYGVLARAIAPVVERFASSLFPVMPIGLTEVKRSLCDRPKATLKVLMAAVTQRYPVLWPLIHEKRSHQVKYWQKAILAMALAIAAQEKRVRTMAESKKGMSHREMEKAASR